MNTVRQISGSQFALMVTAAYIGAGIFQFPRELIVDGGSQAVWAFLLDCGAGVFGLWLWLQVNHLQPSNQVSSFVNRYLTGVLGWPIRIVTVILHLALAMGVVANFSFVMTSFFLPGTPLLAIQIAVVLTAGYMAWFDTPALARVIEVIALPTTALSLIMGILLLPQVNSTYALVPSADLRLSPILLAAYHSFYIFWGYEVTVTLYPFVRDVERQWAERYAIRAMLAACLFFAFGYAITVGTEGPQLMAIAQWPPVSAMRLVNLPAFIINKLGLLIIVLWGLFAETFVATRLWCLAHDIMPVFHAKTSRWYHGGLIVFAAVTVFAASQFPNVADLVVFAQTWITPAMAGYNFLIPPLILLGAFVVRRAARRRGRAVPS
jgi:hypothetical protein